VLQSKDQERFLDMIRGFLLWLPEEHLDSPQAGQHPWLGRQDEDEEQQLKGPYKAKR